MIPDVFHSSTKGIKTLFSSSKGAGLKPSLRHKKFQGLDRLRIAVGLMLFWKSVRFVRKKV